MTRSRDPNLDLLRAIAIVAVLGYHVEGMWPTKYDALGTYAHLGKYGVTLFFVLSGWLIGGIYWREQAKTGNVRVGNFWIRRWLRTAPPYVFGMLLGYAAVYFARSEHFDLRYLAFLQNYEQEVPFYLVSWSLCVEEHFYLFLPLIGLVAMSMSKRWAAIFLWSLPLASPILRLVDPNVDFAGPFGYSHTATHLVAEGLAIGVAAAYTSRFFPEVWKKMQTIAGYLVLPAMIVFVSTTWWGKEMVFYVGQTVVAFTCLVWLAAVAGKKPLVFASSSVVYAIACTSYSIYLTHSLAIHICRRIASPNGSLVSEVICLSVWILVIALAGAGFYFCFERTSIQLRDYVSASLLAGRKKEELA